MKKLSATSAMKNLLILALSLLIPCSLALAEGKSVSVSALTDGFTAYDVQIKAYYPRFGEVSTVSLIDMAYDLGGDLEGEGKEDAKLVAETIGNMQFVPADAPDEELIKDKLHFTAIVDMKRDQDALQSGSRKVSLAFYDMNRSCKLTIWDGSEPVYDGWGIVSLTDVRAIEGVYLERVCALFPSWEE